MNGETDLSAFLPLSAKDGEAEEVNLFGKPGARLCRPRPAAADPVSRMWVAFAPEQSLRHIDLKILPSPRPPAPLLWTELAAGEASEFAVYAVLAACAGVSLGLSLLNVLLQ